MGARDCGPETGSRCTAKVLAAERANAELNATIEKERDNAAHIAAADAVSLRDARAQWVRTHPGCRPSRSGTNSADNGAAGPADTAAGSDATEVLPKGSGDFISTVAAAADALAGYARECHAFVTTLK